MNLLDVEKYLPEALIAFQQTIEIFAWGLPIICVASV
jgi:hypothetical protein